MPVPDLAEPPPSNLKKLFKHFRRLIIDEIDNDTTVLQTYNLTSSPGVTPHRNFPRESIKEACLALGVKQCKLDNNSIQSVQSYSIDSLPGLTVIPNLLPSIAQPELLNHLLHECLSDPANKTNIHAHHHLPYPNLNSNPSQSSSASSFFTHTPDSSSPTFEPLDSTLHNPFTTLQFLNTKLHWLTLGGQYDWTAKEYPSSSPPFPPQLKAFLRPLFPSLDPQAAIMNLYSTSDTLGVHRDIAETSGRELVSLSLGCDALFLAGMEGKGEVVLRVRSGDCVVLRGEARWAWHAVPRILGGTCPEVLAEWPAGGKVEGGGRGDFEGWRGWMKDRRVNLSVRQVYD